MGEPRKMIRLDDEEDREDQDSADEGDVPENMQVVVTPSRVSEFVSKNGVAYQRCGGGRRRLPKRSN